MKVSHELSRRNIEVYLPLQKVLRQWTDRIKKLNVPLFPNYVFVRPNNSSSSYIRNIKGVCNFVSIEGKPATISDNDIKTIKLLELENPQLESGLVEGCEVRIIRGALAGLKGTLFSRKGQNRFCLRVETIKQTLSLEIAAAYLEKV